MPNQNYSVFLQNEPFNWWHVIIPAIITGLITFGAMWFIDNQNKKRWLYESYIKNEAEVLLKAKKLINPVIGSIHSLFGTILCKMGLFTNSIKNPLPTKMREDWKKELLMSFNNIKELYNFFVENDNIFIKHKLDKNLNYLHLYLNLINFIPKNETLEMIESTQQIIDLNTGKEPHVPFYRYKFWYKLIYAAYEWKNEGIRTFGDFDAFITMVDDKIIEQVDDLYCESIKSLEEAQEYLTKITIFDNNNISKDQIKQRWYLDFEGQLFSTESEK